MQKLEPTQVRQVIWALIALQIMLGLANGSTIAIGSLIAAELGGQVAGGLGATMTTVGAAIFAIPLAKMVSKRGRVVSLGLGTIIAIVGAALALIAAEIQHFTLLLVAFIFIGSSIAANFQVRFAAADISTVANRGRNISVVVWATTIGAVAGPNLLPFGSRIGQALGLSDYSGTYVIVLAAQVIALLIIALAVRIPRPETATGGATAPAKPSLWASLRSFGGDFAPGTAYPIVYLAVAHFVMVALMSMTAVHMKAHGAALHIIGLTISLHILGMYGLSPHLRHARG
nr:MFS transporter [Corynebacterium lactis]